MYEIRPANESDAAALAALAEKTFREAFGADNTPEDMELYCARRFGRDIQAGEIMSPSMTTLVADLDGGLIGFGQLYRSAAPPAREPVDNVWLGVWERNARAIAFYAKRQ